MSYNHQDIIQKVQENLKDLNNFEVEDLDEGLFDNFISLVTLDKSIKENGEDIKSLLTTVAEVLNNENLNIDFNKVIELLDAVLLNLSFEEVVELFKFDSMVKALNSPNENLQILALKVSSKSTPTDIIANTEVIPKAVELLASKDTSIRVVNEIEKGLGVLLKGELIRRRLLSDNVVSTLFDMKSSKDTTLKTRLLDLVIQLLPFVLEHELTQELYCFEDFLGDGDILYTLNLIRFYTEILNIVDSSLNNHWLLNNIQPQIEIIGKLYADRYENTDIEYFALTEISLFLKKLSYVSVYSFKSIDHKYVKLTKDDFFLLATLNPSYLATSYSSLLKNINVSADNIPVFRNVISDKTSFELIKPKLTTEKLLRLPYLELVAMLVKLSEFQYSAKYLLEELPQIMNKLLQGQNIVEPESYSLRKATIENLVNYPDETLDIWKEALNEENYKLSHGNPAKSQVMIDDYAL